MHAQEDAPAKKQSANGSSPLLFWRRLAKPQKHHYNHNRAAASAMPFFSASSRQAAPVDGRGCADALDGVDDLMSQLAEQQVISRHVTPKSPSNNFPEQ